MKRYFYKLLIFSLPLLLLNGCAKQQQDTQPKEDLKAKAVALVNKNKHEEAIETLENFINKNPDDNEIHKYKLALADLHFKQGNYPSAYTMYLHYSQYYPADKKAEYAQYHAILSKFYQTLKPDCDQTATEEAIQLCKNYLERIVNQRYRKDVGDIQNTCEHKLFNKEIYVYNFYLKQGNFEAAKTRLNNIKKQYATKKQALEPQLLYLECKLAEKKNDSNLIKKNIEQLINRFPESQYTRMAEAIISKDKFVF